MLKDIRVHGSITQEIDFYANLAGEKLLTAPFYEMKEGANGSEASFFLAGMYLRLDGKGITFSGTGGVVSEYMFGSPMPLQDLSHKEVKNRLVMFGAVAGEGGLTFTPQLSGFQSYESLFLDGNAVGNYYFLIKAPWPFSARRTQETLLRTLGRVLKRSPFPGEGADSDLVGEILKELADPDATLLLLRLVHKPYQRFYQFVRDYYRRVGTWGSQEERFVIPFAEETGVEEYQRERIAIDILYKEESNRQLVDEYKDLLLGVMSGQMDPSALARLNSLRRLAMRHNLPSSLFDTLDGLIPAASAARDGEPDYLRQTREIFESLFIASKPAAEIIGPPEIARLLGYKQQSVQHRDNGFEQILLDTGRMLDERAAQGGDLASFEVFSEVITFFDRLDNAEAVINQLAFMEQATVSESKVRSLVGNQRALDAVEAGLFRRLVVEPALNNPYVLRFGREKVLVLVEGLGRLERGEATLGDLVCQVEAIAQVEVAERRLYEGIRARLKQSYFNLSNPVHVRLLQREVEGEMAKREGRPLSVPPGTFASALEAVKRESEYLNHILPKVLESQQTELRERFLKETGTDRYRLEELEREYQQAHGLGDGEDDRKLGL